MCEAISTPAVQALFYAIALAVVLWGISRL
jgi:hypothetical protein